MKLYLLLVSILLLYCVQPNTAAASGVLRGYRPPKIDLTPTFVTKLAVVKYCPVIVGTPDNLAAQIYEYTSDCREIYLLSAIAKYESTFNPNAKNSKSSARGMYQYLSSTWIDHNCGDLDMRFVVDSAIRCAISDLRRGLGRQWAVWPKVNNNPYGYRI